MARIDVKTQDVVVLYTKSLLTLRQIAAITGMSHTGISKRLKKAGVMNSQVTTPCSFCGKDHVIHRSRFKRANVHYCSIDCYAAALENPGYYPWRHGQRLARAIVSQHFHLEEGNVVHHIDTDCRNNDLSNLAVFANQAEHMRMHRGGKGKPIWEGRLQASLEG